MALPPMYVPTEPKWKHWPTYIYDTNYKYGINFYQPMIDYIDRRGRTSTTSYRDYRSPSRSEIPELPWTDGRLLWGERPVEPYSRRELIQHAIDAEDQAREHLRQFKVANRSDFSLSKTAQASHVTREVLPGRLDAIRIITPWNLFLESARVRSDARQLQRKMAEIDLQCLRDMQSLTEARTTLDQAKTLRGKSAKAIEIQLRAEAMANLNKSQQLADLRKAHLLDQAIFEGREQLRLSRELTRNLIDEERLTAPLDCLSRELKGYEKKSTNYYLNKRYQDPTRPRRLYGCLG